MFVTRFVGAQWRQYNLMHELGKNHQVGGLNGLYVAMCHPWFLFVLIADVACVVLGSAPWYSILVPVFALAALYYYVILYLDEFKSFAFACEAAKQQLKTKRASCLS
jgi:hypothetical protein